MPPSDRRARWFTFGTWMPGGITAHAVQILLLSYLLGFGLPVASAIIVLYQRTARPASQSSGNQAASAALAGHTLVLVLALVATLLGMRTARLSPLRMDAQRFGLRAGRGIGWRSAATVVMYMGVLGITIWGSVDALHWCGIHGTGATSGIDPGRGVLPVEVFHSLVAGVVEEPILLALPIAVAQQARWPWSVTLAVMIALRISFHVYYGWDSLFVVPWIAAAFFLYRWCPVLWPFVLAHGLFDVLETLQTYGANSIATTASSVLNVAVGTGAALVLFVLVVQSRSRSRSREGRRLPHA